MQADAGLMGAADFLHDGKAKPHAASVLAVLLLPKAGKGFAVIGLGQAAAVVFDFQQAAFQYAQNHSALRVAKCVIDQVAE